MKYEFKVKNYSLEKTLLSGQAFRWNKIGDKYVGVVGDSIVEVEEVPGGFATEVKHGSLGKVDLTRYLAVDEDYESIISAISKDKAVRDSLETHKGYRILRQNPYEALISFIDSANNSIRNIRKQVDTLSMMFGERVSEDYYKFPDVDVLAGLTEEEIKKAGVGFRGKYMISTSQELVKNNILDKISELEGNVAHDRLKEFHGVGDKIADCVLLFAYNRLDRVPIDVWTRRIFEKYYSRSCKDKYEELHECASALHGKYAGYAFSFLFEAIRK